MKGLRGISQSSLLRFNACCKTAVYCCQFVTPSCSPGRVQSKKQRGPPKDLNEDIAEQKPGVEGRPCHKYLGVLKHMELR